LNGSYFVCFNISMLGTSTTGIIPECLNCTSMEGMQINVTTYHQSWTFDPSSTYNYLNKNTIRNTINATVSNKFLLSDEGYIFFNYFKRLVQCDNNPYYYSDANVPNSYYRGTESYYSSNQLIENYGVIAFSFKVEGSAVLTKRTYPKLYELVLILVSVYVYFSFIPYAVIRIIYSYLAERMSYNIGLPERDLELVEIEDRLSADRIEMEKEIVPPTILISYHIDKKKFRHGKIIEYYLELFNFQNVYIWPYFTKCICRNRHFKIQQYNDNWRLKHALPVWRNYMGIENLINQLKFKIA